MINRVVPDGTKAENGTVKIVPLWFEMVTVLEAN